jgi:hypothetical protein
MSAPRDSSLNDDDFAAIVNLNNEFFYMHFFDESDTNSDDDADLIVAMATILNEANEAYMPQWRGSVKGRAANLDRNRGEWPRAALCQLLPSGNGVVPKLFSAPFSNVKEVIWANY